MHRATLIQCTYSKRKGKAMAKDLYDESDYFLKQREWAESRDNPWFILSAKYGLVEPHQEIEWYNEKGLDTEKSVEIAETLDGIGVDVVDIQAGMDYTDPLIPELESVGIDVVEHFAGEKIGDRMRLLKENS